VQNDRRLWQLESKLTGKQRALAWLKKQQAMGGYVELGRRALERGFDRLFIDDYDSAFVFECVTVCNTYVLQRSFYGDGVAVKALYLVRLLHSDDRPEESELQRFRSYLKSFVVEGIALADAIQAIDERHFAGHKVLFRDIETALAKRNGVARELCDLYNETARWYEAELITSEELAEAAKVEAPTVEELLMSLTRAQVDLKVVSGLNVKSWLSPILQPSE
jgi:hypothetical protein